MIFFEVFAIFLFGVIMSYLINYLADVLPLKRRLGAPFCIHCGHNTGLINFLIFKKCGNCQKSPTKRRWLITFFFVAAVLFYWFFPLRRLDFLPAVILLGFLTLIVIIDIEYRVVLDITSIIGAAGAFVLGWRLNGLEATLIGGPVGFGVMLLFYYLGILFTKWVSKKRGEEVDEVAMGFGDVKLSGVIGFLLGFPEIIGGILLAFIFGGIGSGLYIIYSLATKQYKSMAAIPYAPFIVLGAMAFFFIPKF
jgi:leader peptidase (prepilin peptidase)/N-methyltransferase